MQRKFFEHDGLKFSYLDSGGDGPVIVALHAAWMSAASYEVISRRLFPRWRMIALDQRGHGESDSASNYSRAAFVGDIQALLDHLGLSDPVIIMGNSVGGTNAFQFASRHPTRVRAMIIEEAGAEEEGDLDFVKNWSGTFPTLVALADAVGKRLYWSVTPSVRETPDGFNLAFTPSEIIAVKKALNGNWWPDWLASKCPALVIKGSISQVVDGALLQKMTELRPNTRLAMIEGGHVAHEDNPAKFTSEIESFLCSVE